MNLRATISNSDHHFWPGQFVDVKLVLSTEKGAVLIPNQAAQISQHGSVRLRCEIGRHCRTSAGETRAAPGRSGRGD